MQMKAANEDRSRATWWAAICAVALMGLPVVAQEPGSAQESAGDEKTVEKAEEEYDWIFDEKRGRKYRVERIPKVEKTHRWVSETNVRFPGGATFEVVDHDENWFYVKVFERLPRKARPKTPAGPTPEEIQAVEETYETSFEAVDRLNMTGFDKGLPRSGQWRNGFDLADMNGDGHLDIVFGPARKGRQAPNIFLGDGAGNWSPWTTVRYPPAPYDYGDVAVGDLDQDGNLDLVFGVHLRGLIVLRSTGEGVFELWSSGVEVDMPGQGGDATSFSSRTIELFDWNSDGNPDIIALGEGPKGLKTKADKDGNNQLINTSRGFLVYLNNGDGSWKVYAQERQNNERANFGDDFAIGDIDGDGIWDLISATRQLGSQAIWAKGDDDSLSYENVEEVRPKAFVDSVELADLDLDGRQDVVLSYRNRELEDWRVGIDILYSKEGGGYNRVPLFSLKGRDTIGSLALGHLDKDGRLDIVAGNSNGALKIYLSDKEKGFVEETSPELDQKRKGCLAFGTTLVDLDGDGIDEIVSGFAGEPTGYPGFPNLSKPGCVREGSIRVWKISSDS